MSENCRQSVPFTQARAHDMLAAEGLGQSAEHVSIPHCSPLCFSSSSPSSSLSEEYRTKAHSNYPCQTCRTHGPLPKRKAQTSPTTVAWMGQSFCCHLSETLSINDVEKSEKLEFLLKGQSTPLVHLCKCVASKQPSCSEAGRGRQHSSLTCSGYLCSSPL